MIDSTTVVSVRNGRIASLSPNHQDTTNEVVSFDAERRPLKVGDRVKPDENAPGDMIRSGDRR